MAAQQESERIAGEVALGIEERRGAQLQALVELQQQLEDRRLARAQAAAERREHHERVLLELRLRHEQLVADQMARLSNWQLSER